MKLERKRLGAIAALATAGTLGLAASAHATTLPGFNLPPLPAYQLPTGGWPTSGLPAFNPAGLSFVGPSIGSISSVIGPTVITVGAGNIFTGTTITTSGGGSVVTAGTGAP
jgi:hypothetical protein